MKTAIAVICSGLFSISCNKAEFCPEAETSTFGAVRSITGPDTLSLGKTVALIIEVAANDSFCTKRAEGYIIDASSNYLQIGAHLIHVEAGSKNCACMKAPTIKTLLYFTPNKAGSYVFGTKKKDISSGGNPPSDTSNYRVFVQ